MFDKKEFEAQVQERLHELDISPSPAVWDKIEAQLPPENKRRRIVLWSTIMVAAMCAGGYFFFLNAKLITDKANNSTLSVNTPEHKTSAVTDRNIPSDPRAGTPDQLKSTSAGMIPVDPVNTNKGAITDETNPAPSGAVNEVPSARHSSAGNLAIAGSNTSPVKHGISGETVILNKTIRTRSSSARIKAAHKNRVSDKTVIPAKDHGNTLASDTRDGDKDPAANAGKDVVTKNATGYNNATDSTYTENIEKLTDHQGSPAGNDHILQEETALSSSAIDTGIIYHSGFEVNASVKELETVAAVTPLTKNKRWSFEIGASGGQSIYNTGEVNKLFQAADPAVLNSTVSTNYNGVSAAPQRPVISSAAPYVPSEIKPGKSFSLGMDARYRVNRRISFTGGLYYSLLTTTIKTGNKGKSEKSIDVNGRQRKIKEFYGIGYNNEYTNAYHFIELPVLVHLQMNQGRKLPLFLNAGISYARLLKTNTLHYDESALIYYKASELVKRDFLNVEGGISAKLFASKWYSFIIGPEIQYGITNLFKKDVQQNDKHSLFLGIKASVPLNL